MSWQELQTASDLENLMWMFGNFHDGCVREIHVATGHHVDQNLSMTVDWRTTVHMLIQRQFVNPSAIELRFEEVVGLSVSPPSPNSGAVIFDAALLLRDGMFYWADDGRWTPDGDRDDTTWVAARKLYWRDASEWMGPELRYRVEG